MSPGHVTLRSQGEGAGDKARWTQVSGDTGAMGQAGAGMRDEGRAPVEVRTRHEEAKKVSCNLGRPYSVNFPTWAPEQHENFQSSQPKL